MFSEMLVSTYKSTWRQSPEDQHRNLQSGENLKSYINEIRTKLAVCTISIFNTG
jgi:hypothetical protein